MGKTWDERIEAMARESWNRGRLEPEIVWDDLDETAQEFYLQEARRDAEAFCDGDTLYERVVTIEKCEPDGCRPPHHEVVKYVEVTDGN